MAKLSQNEILEKWNTSANSNGQNLCLHLIKRNSEDLRKKFLKITLKSLEKYF